MNEETTTPITIATAQLDSNVWAQATLYTGKPIQSDNNTYYEFVKSLNERDAKIDKCIIKALSFLYKEGYITQEEYMNRESERLNNIRTYEIDNGRMAVWLSFDEDEWTLYIIVDSTFKVNSVVFCDGEEEPQILYGSGTFD